MPAYDRIIDIEERVVTRDDFGDETVVWANIANLWASVNQTGISENFENDANREQPLRNATFRIHWRDGIDETMRVVYDGHGWDIEGIGEIGFRRELELHCQTDASRRTETHPLTVLAGLSDDAVPDAAELTIQFVDGGFTFEAFMDMHVIIARLESEPDIQAIVLEDDVTEQNQIEGFTKRTTVDINGNTVDDTVTVAMDDFKVWVSNQMLTFADERVMEVA